MEINENEFAVWANLTDEDMIDFAAQQVHPV